MNYQQKFTNFAFFRIIVGLLIAVLLLWIATTAVRRFEKPKIDLTSQLAKHQPAGDPDHTRSKGEIHDLAIAKEEDVSQQPVSSSTETLPKEGGKTDAHRDIQQSSHGEETSSQQTSRHAAPQKQFPATGMAFVDAVIRPMEYELIERFWGWRPNDILNVTDNVNSFQLGVLEVTRRTVVNLTERISRTGSTEAFDRNLQNAMNWFMIKADKFWFPSAESKYKAGLEELNTYFKKLEKGTASFYTRTDNLIPLLMAYQDLLGSCDENLVKTKEKTGEPVSHFRADNYFYYAQGVASTMETILEAILEDFSITIENRRGTEVLHRAIDSCRLAAKIDPWLITNSKPGSIVANHRANLAAPISHARFYIGVLIKTLST